MGNTCPTLFNKSPPSQNTTSAQQNFRQTPQNSSIINHQYNSNYGFINFNSNYSTPINNSIIVNNNVNNI